MQTYWIGNEASQFTTADVGQVGFIVSLKYLRNGSRTVYELRQYPARTNMSHVERLHGWCGTTNDVSVDAHGMGRIVRVARNGRALVKQIDGDDMAAALDELGYPDLAQDTSTSRHSQRPDAVHALTSSSAASTDSMTWTGHLSAKSDSSGVKRRADGFFVPSLTSTRINRVPRQTSRSGHPFPIAARLRTRHPDFRSAATTSA